MSKENKELLESVIKSELEYLSDYRSVTEDKTIAIDNLVKLYKLNIEETKCELEIDEKRDRALDESILRDRECEFKNNQLIEQSKDRYFRLGIEITGIVLPLIFYGVWMNRGFKFEENGTYTSTTFRGLFNRFKPSQK